MNRYFAIYHGLTPSAPWGVAVERPSGSPRVKLLMLCRSETNAIECASLTALGQGLKSFRDQQVKEQGKG